MVCGVWAALTIGHLPFLSSLSFKYYYHNQVLPKATLKLNNMFFPVQPHWRQRSRCLRPPRPRRGQVQGWKGRTWGLWWGSHNSKGDHHLIVGDGGSTGKKNQFYSIREAVKDIFLGIFSKPVDPHPPLCAFRNKNVNFGQKVGFSRPKTMATKISHKGKPTPPF